MSEKARDFKGISGAQESTIQAAQATDELAYSGINGKKLIEAVPSFDRTPVRWSLAMRTTLGLYWVVIDQLISHPAMAAKETLKLGPLIWW